jgi:P22 coat protein - gene protein 5
MANVKLTADVIAAEALMLLDNNLVMANKVYRGYESEYSKSVNGYQKGATIRIRRPTDFTVRDGAVAATQDVVEGTTTLVVNKQKGIDSRFTSSELTLDIREFSDRVMKPAMIQLANQVDRDVMSLYQMVWNWVGTAGQTVNSFTDFALGPQRLDDTAVPQDTRSSVLAPADYWGMLGSQTALFFNTVGVPAFRNASLGQVGGVETLMSQNVPTLTTGTRVLATGGVTKAAGTGGLSTTWALSKDTNSMQLSTNGWTSASTIKAGEVFTISTIYAVNPVTKATLPYLQQFVVLADVTADGTTTNETTLLISPPIITSGAFQTVSATPVAAQTITIIGTSATNYVQNLVFHKNAFTLAMVPLEMPQGVVDAARKTYKGLSCRVVPYYDGTNDISNWRLDILYGVKAIDPRLATRLSGTP